VISALALSLLFACVAHAWDSDAPLVASGSTWEGRWRISLPDGASWAAYADATELVLTVPPRPGIREHRFPATGYVADDEPSVLRVHLVETLQIGPADLRGLASGDCTSGLEAVPGPAAGIIHWFGCADKALDVGFAAHSDGLLLQIRVEQLEPSIEPLAVRILDSLRESGRGQTRCAADCDALGGLFRIQTDRAMARYEGSGIEGNLYGLRDVVPWGEHAAEIVVTSTLLREASPIRRPWWTEVFGVPLIGNDDPALGSRELDLTEVCASGPGQAHGSVRIMLRARTSAERDRLASLLQHAERGSETPRDCELRNRRTVRQRWDAGREQLDQRTAVVLFILFALALAWIGRRLVRSR
jgi:hypothetical protein